MMKKKTQFILQQILELLDAQHVLLPLPTGCESSSVDRESAPIRSGAARRLRRGPSIPDL